MNMLKVRKSGQILGRAGIAEEIIDIANEIVKDGSYKKAIECAGMIEVLAQACSYDTYWDEKINIGTYKQWDKFEDLLEAQKTPVRGLDA